MIAERDIRVSLMVTRFEKHELREKGKGEGISVTYITSKKDIFPTSYCYRPVWKTTP